MNYKKFNYIIVLLILSTSCEKEKVVVNDTVKYKDIVPDKELTSFLDTNSNIYPPYGCGTYYELDLNQDGISDFYFSTQFWIHTEYRKWDEHQFLVREAEHYCEHNPFNSGISIDMNSNFQFSKVNEYRFGDTLNDNFNENETWLYKVDNVDSLITKGNFYIGVQLNERLENIGINIYYGWIQVEMVNKWSLILKDYAYSTIPNKKLKLGMKEF